MKIVIDIDDTVADTSNYLMQYAQEFDKTLRGEGIVNPNMNMPRCFNWTEEETQKFLDTIFDKYVDDVPPVLNAVECINSLKRAGHTIVFASSRNDKQMREPYERTLAWLKKNNFQFDKLIVKAKHKGPVIEEEGAQVFIDDSVGQTTYVSDYYDINVILFSNTKEAYSNIAVINTWNKVLEHISGIHTKDVIY